MDPQPTAVERPIQLRIADDIRMKIEAGDLRPGDALPTLAEICHQWDCSMNSARGAVALLKSQGLITAGRGKAPRVRIPPARVIRSSDRHQAEKDLARRPEKERSAVGEAETNLGMTIGEQDFRTKYTRTEANTDLSKALQVPEGEALLQRTYESFDPSTGKLLSHSNSYIPVKLIEGNKDLMDETKEPWPGGTMHQLSTVGIEVMTIVDEVTARMPTTVEAQSWGLNEGIPLVICRRISLDAEEHVIEVSDADYPADRTQLRFTTPLKPWKRGRSNREPQKG